MAGLNRMSSEVLNRLAQVLQERKSADPKLSYSGKLFSEGLDAILKKIGEEATETVLAAKNGKSHAVIHEVADLWFHSLVLLAWFNLQPEDILAELHRREGQSGIAEKAARGKAE